MMQFDYTALIFYQTNGRYCTFIDKFSGRLAKSKGSEIHGALNRAARLLEILT